MWSKIASVDAVFSKAVLVVLDAMMQCWIQGSRQS